MARLARVVALGGAFASLAASIASAQLLARLHVRTFTLSADTYAPYVGQQLHLTIVAHVDERIAALDNVDLPDLSGFDIYGDERRCVAAARKGTDCIESLTVAPKESGTRAIEPATLEAIDARNGKPSRFATNRITLRVSPDPAAAMRSLGSTLRGVVLDALRTILIALLVVAALFALAWGYGRRRRAVDAAFALTVPVAAAAPTAPLDPSAEWRALVDRLANDRTRANVILVRAVLRRWVGAREEETFGDLVRRDALRGDPELAGAMHAIECAAFCADVQLADAVGDALPRLAQVDASPERMVT